MKTQAHARTDYRPLIRSAERPDGAYRCASIRVRRYTVRVRAVPPVHTTFTLFTFSENVVREIDAAPDAHRRRHARRTPPALSSSTADATILPTTHADMMLMPDQYTRRVTTPVAWSMPHIRP